MRTGAGPSVAARAGRQPGDAHGTRISREPTVYLPVHPFFRDYQMHTRLWALVGVLLAAPLAAQVASPPTPAAVLPRFDNTGVGDTSIFAPLDLPPGNLFRSGSGAPGPMYWQNHADYDIKASLDTTTKTLTGSLRLRYTNNSPDTLRFIWVQMEQNAFKDKSLNSFIYPQDSRFGARGFEGGDVVDRFEQVLTGGAARRVNVARRANGNPMKADIAEPRTPRQAATVYIA